MIRLVVLTLLDCELHIVAWIYDAMRVWALSAERRAKRMVESAQKER